MSDVTMPPHFIRLLGQAADTSEDAIARLLAAATLRADLDEWLKDLATDAREQGATWATLGTVLDVTRQAVQKRFSNPGGHRAWRYDTSEAEPQLRPMSDDRSVELLVEWLDGKSDAELKKNWSALPDEMLDKLPEAIREKVRRAIGRDGS